MSESVSRHKVLREASFDPKLPTYLLLQGTIVFVVLIVTIPLAVVYFLVGKFFIDKYIERMELDASEHAAMLEAIAEAIHALGDDLVKLAANETGFSAVRIVAERERLMLTLRMFADLVRLRKFDRACIDTAEPSRRPLPKPDMVGTSSAPNP